MMRFQHANLIKLCFIGFFIYLLLDSKFFGSFQASVSWKIFISVLLVQPIVIFCIFLLAIRHVLLIGEPRIRLGLAFRAITLSQGLNLLLPARLSELLKATYLRDHANVPLSNGFSAIVLERTVDILIVAIMGVVGIVLYFDSRNFSLIPALGLLFAILIFILVRSPRLVLRLLNKLPSKRLTNFLVRTYQHFSATAGTQAFLYALLLGVTTWAFSYLNILIFFKYAGSIQIGFSGALLLFFLTTLGGAIPALPGGVGTYEAAAIIALRSLGYTFEEALPLAVALHLAQLILPFIMAILIMFTERIGLSSLISELQKSVSMKNNFINRRGSGKKIND
jgi:uncharacterized protein (TIRG00374 family)